MKINIKLWVSGYVSILSLIRLIIHINSDSVRFQGIDGGVTYLGSFVFLFFIFLISSIAYNICFKKRKREGEQTILDVKNLFLLLFVFIIVPLILFWIFPS